MTVRRENLETASGQLVFVTNPLDLPLWSWQKAPLVCNVVLCSFYRFDLLGNFVFILSKPRRECWMILFHNCVFCPAIILPFFPRPSVCPHFSTALFKGKVAVWIIRGPIKLYILRIQIILAFSPEQRDSRMGQVYNLPLCLFIICKSTGLPPVFPKRLYGLYSYK